jgi:hypothetical protein
VNARGNWANRPVTTSTPTSTSTTRTRLRGRARSLSPPQRFCGPCRPPRPLRRGTYIARCRPPSSRRPSSRPKARRHAFANRGMREAMGPHRGANPRSMRVKRRGYRPTRDARRPRSGSSTRAGRWTATPATSSTLGVRARQMHERRQATTLDGVGATTAMRTALRRRSPREPACSAGRSARRPSPNASASPRPSLSTTGRRIPAYGSTITTWHASWAGPPAMRSSSATCPCTLAIQPGRGSSTCPPARSTTGTIWSARSWATSRAHMCALGIPGICAPAPRGPASRSGISYGLLQALYRAPKRGAI